MKTKDIKDISVQGAEVVTAKTQKKSITYALKAITNHIKTLEEQELLNPKEIEGMRTMVKYAAQNHIKKEYGI